MKNTRENMRTEQEGAGNTTGQEFRLALLTKVFPPFSYGGTESYSSELASQLARRDDIELHVLCFQSAEDPVAEEELMRFMTDAPYTVHIIGSFFKNFMGFHSLANYWKVRSSLSRTLRDIRPRLLQTIGVYSETILALGVARGLGIPTIVFPRGSDLGREMNVATRSVYKRFVFGRAEAVFSQTRTAQEELRRTGFIGPGKDKKVIRVVPNGLELSACGITKGHDDTGNAREAGSDVFRILWVGRFEEVKDPARALDVFSHFSRKVTAADREGVLAPEIIMVGDGSLLREMKEKAGDTENIVLKGKLPREEVFRLMRESDVLINTSRSEGFPESFLEAMAHGLPVVCFDVSANSEIIRDDVNGIVVGAGDTEAFARGLQRLYENLELRRRMGERSREEALKYDWSRLIDGMVTVYRELVKGR